MRPLSKKSTMVLTAIATPLALVVLGATVYQASYVAFTDQVSDSEPSTVSVNLTDDDDGRARFRVTNMLPGDTDTKCITVTADVSVPSTVKGYYTINRAASIQALEDHIFVTVESGNGGSFATCDGFTAEETIVDGVSLSTVAQSRSFETAHGGWAVSPGVSSKTYKITWTFDTANMTQAQIDDLQGVKADVDMQWEMRTDEAH